MDWNELRKLLFESILFRNGCNIVFQDEEKAKEFMRAIHKIAREGCIIK
jgi:hypothetical protein